MNSADNLYCRFCAEPKSTEKLLNLQTDTKKQDEIISKLTHLNAIFVDITNCDCLPKTICFVCYDSLNKAYEFLEGVKRAQDVLSTLFTTENNKYISDEVAYDDVLSLEAVDDDPVKVEMSIEVSDSEVKQEPIEENESEVQNESDSLDSFRDPKVVEYYDHGKDSQVPTTLIKLLTSTFNFEQSQPEDTINTWRDYPMICKFCKAKVADKDVLNSHCVEVHRKCFGLSCIDCDRELECFKDFLKHVIGHRPYLRNICPYCNKVIDADSDHIKVEHTANKHPCIICGNIYQNKRSLREHEAIVDPSPLNTPPKNCRRNPMPPPTLEDRTCHICDAVMKTRASLKSHLLQHGEKKKNYTCDRCGKSYFMKGNFVAHRLIHENVERSVCRICNKSFLTLGRLRRHIMTHNLEKPFQCDVCKRYFSSKETIRVHVKLHMNMNIKPFKCNFCPKKFKFIGLLKTHENQHTGARPFKCEFCLKDFTNWSNCNKHMKRKHNKTLATHVRTQYGKLAVDPETGKAKEFNMDHGIKEWTTNIMKKKRNRKN